MFCALEWWMNFPEQNSQKNFAKKSFICDNSIYRTLLNRTLPCMLNSVRVSIISFVGIFWLCALIQSMIIVNLYLSDFFYKGTSLHCLASCRTSSLPVDTWAHIYYHCLTVIIPAWISNHTPSKVWDEITYPFLNFNGTTVEVKEWISYFIPHIIMGVITYPWWD